MDSNQIIIFCIFLVGYALFTVEHVIKLNKTGIALILAAVLWVFVFMLMSAEEVDVGVRSTGAEIAEIVIFLLCAMSLVEVIVHFKFFEWVKYKLLQRGLSDRKQFYLLALVTFFTSALLDNLTTTIIIVTIARAFFKPKDIPYVAAGIVVVANAGGAWSPLGDVTTIMLWVQCKFTASQIIVDTLVPSLVMGLVSTLWLGRGVANVKSGDEKPVKVVLSKSQKIVIGTALTGFAFPVIFSSMGVPPFFGLMLGLGLVWLVIELLGNWSSHTDLTDTKMDNLLRKIDIQSIKFFIGILFCVGALKEIGILAHLSLDMYGANADFYAYIKGSSILGVASSLFDNVPLTAAAMDIIQTTDFRIWTFTAFTVGTGGSLLLIGSAAGVVAGGMVPSLTFGKYMKVATLPVLFGYIAGIAVWLLQNYLFYN
ncbi:sodium:proton antiporter NhaD [Candidatus Nomurabacteria bacterium]|nr:sodium:proton antiporter NhaD [Candidatus Nomurabacteria bacterium]